MSGNKTYICLDPGSTWNGKREYGYELIDLASQVGAQSIKFQLFDDDLQGNGNIKLPLDTFLDFHQYGKKVGIPVTASVFYEKALEAMFKLDVPFIKFAYSQGKKKDWIQACLNVGKNVVVSGDEMTLVDCPVDKRLTKLFCIPQYPLQYLPNFECKFPVEFQGFSDHSRGHKVSVAAVKNGARFIEKHFNLYYSDIKCPDSRFALKPKEAEEFVNKIRLVENQCE